MEEDIRAYIRFFGKEIQRREHILKRFNGYMDEMSRLTSMLLVAPDDVFENVRDELDATFSQRVWCPTCEAKKAGFLFLIFKNRDAGIAKKYHDILHRIQHSRLNRAIQEGTATFHRFYLNEVMDAVDRYGKDVFLLSPDGELYHVETYFQDFVYTHTALFDMSTRQFKMTFDKFGESIKQSGHAWDKIRGKLLRQGWGFVNYDVNHSTVKIEFDGRHNVYDRIAGMASCLKRS